MGEECGTLTSLARLAAHALRGRIGRDQLRMLGLQVFELPHQLVEFGVADLGLVENVIEGFVVANFLAERADPFLEVFGSSRHRKRL